MTRPEDRPEVEIDLRDLTPTQANTILQVLRRIEARRQSEQPACRHCGLPVIWELDRRWTHLASSGLTWVGCRAASWDGERWADMPRHWRATPT